MSQADWRRIMKSMQKVWVCGASGKVGSELVKLLGQMTEKGMEVLVTDSEDVDITVPKDVVDFAELNRPHHIINCAGFTDVNACEREVEKAYKVNALGARNLAVASRKISARLVHLSTDDVFGGDGKIPYTEFDTPNPQSIYGKSKYAGENFIREFSNKHIIIRSSWIYGQGDSYLSKILNLAKEGKNIEAAHDQIASPTSAKELAKTVIYLMEYAQDGLYHITGQGSCSRYEFAHEILKLAGSQVAITPVTASEDPLTAMRPSYSVLDNLMLRMSDIPMLSDWKKALADCMNENRLVK